MRRGSTPAMRERRSMRQMRLATAVSPQQGVHLVDDHVAQVAEEALRLQSGGA